MSAYTEDEAVAESMEEEEACAYEEIEKLQEMGVNAQDIKRMKEAGIHTVQNLFMQTRKVHTALPPPPSPYATSSPCTDPPFVCGAHRPVGCVNRWLVSSAWARSRACRRPRWRSCWRRPRS